MLLRLIRARFGRIQEFLFGVKGTWNWKESIVLFLESFWTLGNSKKNGPDVAIVVLGKYFYTPEDDANNSSNFRDYSAL